MSLPESGEWRRGLYQIINSNSHESAREWKRGLYQIINSNSRESAGEWRTGLYQIINSNSRKSAGEWKRGLYQIINSNSHESAGEWRTGLYQIINSNDRCLLLAVNPQCVFVCKSLSRYSLFIFLCVLFDSLTTEHDDVELPILQLDVSIRHRGLIAPFLFHFDEHRQALFLDTVDDLGRWRVPYPCSSLPRK